MSNTLPEVGDAIDFGPHGLAKVLAVNTDNGVLLVRMPNGQAIDVPIQLICLDHPSPLQQDNRR
jgi:hypothetical protein